jgi:uncharacterized protein YbaP (TraB family)
MTIMNHVMTKLTRNIFFTLVATLALTITAAAQGKCFMWEAKSASSTVYLCGSVHLAAPDLYPLDPAIENAFAKSDALVVEVHLSPAVQQKAMTLIMQKGLYEADDSLNAHLSSAAQAKLGSFLRTIELDPATFTRTKPWYVGMMLVIREAQRLGYSQELGIDKHFVTKATGIKTILELETIEEQVNLLSSGTDKEQELALMEGLDQLPTIEEQLKIMMTAWKTGDASSMATVINENLPKHPDLNTQRKRLLDDRNVKMANIIKGYMKKKKTYFVVVGSAHLVGENGIVRLLQKNNYSVTQVSRRSQ